MAEETPADLRVAYDSAVADAKTERSRADLAEAKLSAIGEGYAPEYGELYASQNTEQEFVDWAAAFKLPKVTDEASIHADPPPTTPDTPAPSPGTPEVDETDLAGFGSAGTRAGDGGGDPPGTPAGDGTGLTVAEWRKIYTEDGREAAEQALKDKGWEARADNPYVTRRS